jgi:hypothetical protein
VTNYLENRVEDKLAKGVKAFGGLAFKFKPFGIIGVPDRIVLLPGGRLIFVELKKPDGTVKPWQTRMHETLRNLGFRVEVLFTLSQVATFLASVNG